MDAAYTSKSAQLTCTDDEQVNRSIPLKPQILVIDDHELIYKGLESELNGGGGIFFYAPSLDCAQKLLAEQHFYCCLLDISFGSETSLGLLPEIVAKMPVFMLSMHKVCSYIKMAQSLGASGYFLKDESMELLVEAIKYPSRHEFWVSESVLSILAAKAEQTGFQKLSDREKQVFILFAEGHNYKAVAKILSLSPKTVNIHKANIFTKMKLSSLVELAKEARNLGLI